MQVHAYFESGLLSVLCHKAYCTMLSCVKYFQSGFPRAVPEGAEWVRDPFLA